MKRRCTARASAAVALLLAAFPTWAVAQYTAVPGPAAYALQGVTVVQADGRRTQDVTLVVRGRFIEAMGPGIEVPADAEVLEGDSLLVYPGLVDAWGMADFEFPTEEVDRSRVELWNAPRSLEGFMPSRLVSHHLTATGASLADERRKGVVAAAVHPDGAMMPGRGAALLFRPDAATPRDLVLFPALGPTMTWQGGSGVYPSTLFGVTAYMRQSLEDARWQQAVAAAYEENPRGVPTPTHDPDYAVLQQVLGGATPVFFHASSSEDILRVLALAREYGFQPVIVGGGDAWKVADRLRAAGVAVLVDLDFPEPQRWDGPEDEAEAEAEPEAEAEAMDAATLREKQRLEDRYSNAGRLAAAGVTFALTSGGGDADLRKGARLAIRYGLAEEAALEALTATPAELLGAPQLARVEAGLAATFVVTDGPLFNEDTGVIYTFVEGRKEDGTSGGAAGDEPPAVDVTGDWDIEIESDAGTIRGTLTLTQDEAEFTGSLVTEFGPATVRSGIVSGNELTFLVEADENMKINFTGTVEGDEASGSGRGPVGSLRWTATRSGGPGGSR